PAYGAESDLSEQTRRFSRHSDSRATSTPTLRSTRARGLRDQTPRTRSRRPRPRPGTSSSRGDRAETRPARVHEATRLHSDRAIRIVGDKQVAVEIGPL